MKSPRDEYVDPHQEVLELSKRITISSNLLPECEHTDDLQARRLTGGITNHLITVFCVDDPSQTLVVRIYGLNTDIVINREREKLVSRFLYETRGIGKRIFRTFNHDGQTGVIEEFLEGRTLEPHEMIHTPLSAKIAQKMAHMHSTHIPLEMLEQIRQPEKGAKSCLWPLIWKWYTESSQLKNTQTMQQVDFDKIGQEIKQIEQYTKRFNSPCVLSHNDLLSGNLFLDKKGNINFIDFEYSAMSERGFDIANFFNESVLNVSGTGIHLWTSSIILSQDTTVM